MKLENLSPSTGGGSKAKKRLGRGMGSGHGKTSGRGHDGQNARSGGGTRPGFEGGQMPLFQRLPKRGFTNIFAKEFAIVNLSQLDVFEDGTVVTPELLIEAGLVKKNKIGHGIKVLGNGEISKKLTIQAHKFSEAAVEKITSAGGKTEVI